MRKTHIIIIAIVGAFIGGVIFGIAFTVPIARPFNKILLVLSVAMMWAGVLTAVLMLLTALVKRMFK